MHLFKDKTVFITGHTGFIGSWLSLLLTKLGAIVCGYSLPSGNDAHLFQVLQLEKKIIHHHGDIRDFGRLRLAVKKCRPEFVFHLAAQPDVKDSLNDPRGTYEINVNGTLNLLEAIRECASVKVLVHISTFQCYEKKANHSPFTEIDTIGGTSPYSISKSCGELLVSSYAKAFLAAAGMSIACARIGSIIGGGDVWKNRLLPYIIRSLILKKEIVIFHPEFTSPWLHALELSDGLLRLAENMWGSDQFNGCWNFGPDDCDALTVKEVVEKAIAFWGQGSYRIGQIVESRPEVEKFAIDSSKAKSFLGWTPLFSSEKRIEQTVKWYKTDFEGHVDMLNLSLEQIENYKKIAGL